MGQDRPVSGRSVANGAEGIPDADRAPASAPSAQALLALGLRLLPALLLALSVGAAVAVYLGGDPGGPVALTFIWVAGVSFALLSRPLAVIEVAVAGVAYGWALYTMPGEPLLTHWLPLMATALAAGLLAAHMRDRAVALETRLSDATRNDALTSLLNRRALEEQLAMEVERATRSGSPLTVMVGDIDSFRTLNERLGHDAGDGALRLVARDLQKWKRRIDVAARIGGEEFALLLPDTDERGAFIVAERLRRAAHRTFSDEPARLTISFGIASFPEHAAEAGTLVHMASRAVLAAKDMGSDRTVVYSPELEKMLYTGEARCQLQLASVIGLAEALDIRDNGTTEHCHAVGRYSEMTAKELGLSPDHVERVRLAGVIHDVGKIGITECMFTKAGPLEDEEWAELRTHPLVAARLLSGPEFDDLRSWVEAHHERPDGTGYPLGLKGDAIPLEARILAVADAYEAMTADRVYRPPLGEEAARAELALGSGTQFDPGIVEAFLRALDGQRPPVAAQAS
jgi:diguanylate cyclase (GGDEF)-like protein